MAILLSTVKVALISTGVLSMAFLVKLYASAIVDFAVSEVPSIWSSIISWLRPPYLYVVINAIIISILASSKLQQKLDGPLPPLETGVTQVAPPPVALKFSRDGRSTEYVVYDGVVLDADVYNENPTKVADIQEMEPENLGEVIKAEVFDAEMKTKSDKRKKNGMINGGDEDVASLTERSAPQRQDSLELSFPEVKRETPPVSARFGHRKAGRASPEGKALGVTRPRRNDTLESTWRAITEGRSMPLTRHLKKSDTWDVQSRRNAVDDDINAPPKMKKSETFNDGNTAKKPPVSQSSGLGKLKRDPSLSQDELNRRVEAFIKKFNEEMRLQRQESLKQYQEMINRGIN